MDEQKTHSYLMVLRKVNEQNEMINSVRCLK